MESTEVIIFQAKHPTPQTAALSSPNPASYNYPGHKMRQFTITGD